MVSNDSAFSEMIAPLLRFPVQHQAKTRKGRTNLFRKRYSCNKWGTRNKFAISHTDQKRGEKHRFGETRTNMSSIV